MPRVLWGADPDNIRKTGIYYSHSQKCPIGIRKMHNFILIRKKMLPFEKNVRASDGDFSGRLIFPPITVSSRSVNSLFPFGSVYIIYTSTMSEERLVDAVVDRIFNRINQVASPSNNLVQNSSPLPDAIQRIVGNPSFSSLEGELQNRFNTVRPQTPQSQSASCSREEELQNRFNTIRPRILQSQAASCSSSTSTTSRYNPATPYGRPAPSCGRRRGKRTMKGGSPVEKVTYKDFFLLPSNVENIPRGKERSQLEKEGFVVHAVPLKHSSTEKEIEDLVNTIFADKLSVNSTGEKRYRNIIVVCRFLMFLLLLMAIILYAHKIVYAFYTDVHFIIYIHILERSVYPGGGGLLSQIIL